MFSQKNFINILFSFAIAALLKLFLVSASAQAESSEWAKVCTKNNENQNICTTLKNVFSDLGQPLTTVNVIDYNKKSQTHRIQIAVPTGRRVQEGVKIQIGNQPVQKMDYLFCVGLSCVAEGAIDKKTLDSMKKSKEMIITSVNYEGVPNPIKVPLDNFAKAFFGPGEQASNVAKEQKKLIDDLNKKEKNFVDKLKKEQNKIKNTFKN